MAASILFVVFSSFVVVSNARTIVLGGGNMDPGNDAFFGKIVQLAGGQGVAKIGIITAANRLPEDNFLYYRDVFEQYGVQEAAWIPVHEANKSANSDPGVVALIRSMTGFFYGGGNRGRLVDSFYNDGRVESPALATIREVHTAGAVISGVSAGMVSQTSVPMILLGESWNALRYGACEKEQVCARDDLQYDKDGGLQMFDGYVIDSHFSERGREGRLVRMIADTMDIPKGVKLGFGVDENSALIISNVGTNNEIGELVGVGGAYFVDLTSSTIDDSGLYWRIQNVNAHFLTEGDKINLKSGEVTIAPGKQNIQGNELNEFASTSDKIFNGNYEDPTSPSEYVRVATSLVDCTRSNTTFGDSQTPDPYFRVEFSWKSNTVGCIGTSSSNGGRIMSYLNMNIGMGPRT